MTSLKWTSNSHQHLEDAVEDVASKLVGHLQIFAEHVNGEVFHEIPGNKKKYIYDFQNKIKTSNNFQYL